MPPWTVVFPESDPAPASTSVPVPVFTSWPEPFTAPASEPLAIASTPASIWVEPP